MRVNIYAEEMTERVEIISKEIEGKTFTGLRLYLELPVSYYQPDTRSPPYPVPLHYATQAEQLKGPFVHHPGDDDSAAVTFWGKRDLRDILKIMLAKLDEHYGNEIPRPAFNKSGFS